MKIQILIRFGLVQGRQNPGGGGSRGTIPPPNFSSQGQRQDMPVPPISAMVDISRSPPPPKKEKKIAPAHL